MHTIREKEISLEQEYEKLKEVRGVLFGFLPTVTILSNKY